jgi:hypothetical protein
LRLILATSRSNNELALLNAVDSNQNLWAEILNVTYFAADKAVAAALTDQASHLGAQDQGDIGP